MGFLPICYFPRRVPGIDVGRCWGRMRLNQPLGMGRLRHRPEEAQTLLKIPNPRIGKGIPIQRIRLEAKTLGTSEKLEPDRAPSEDMVPEQADEEQKELAEASRPGPEQQQQQFEREQPQPPHGPPPRARSASRVEPPRGQRNGCQAPSVTHAFLWGFPAPLPPSRHRQLNWTNTCDHFQKTVSDVVAW